MAESTDEQNQLLGEKLYPDVQKDSEALAADTPPAYTDAAESKPGPIVNQPESTAPPAATAAPKNNSSRVSLVAIWATVATHGAVRV